MQLTKDQVNTILKNAPAGMDKRAILDGLITRGYELEGVDTNLARQQIQAKQAPTVEPQAESQQGPLGTLLGPAKEGIEGLKTLYGGGEQGIAQKLKRNVTEGADAIQQGMQKGGVEGAVDALKGAGTTAFRTAGDVAGTVFAPIGAAIGATGIGKGFEWIGQKAVENDPLIKGITENESFQKFAMGSPNAEEDFGRALSLTFAAKASKGPSGQINPKTMIPRTIQQVKGVQNAVTAPFKGSIDTLRAKTDLSNIQNKTVDQLRSEKVTKGYMDQNTRLKTVNKAFNENTKTFKLADGKIEKVTPVDTLSKHNIKPNIQKGTIDMGSYEQGTGGLGKIKSLVEGLDDEIQSKLSSSGKSTSINTFKEAVIKEIKKNPDLKRTGTVQTTLNKIDTVFNDFQASYGNKIGINEINAIRKSMNRTFNPETYDVNRSIGNAGRQIVYNATPDKAIRTLLTEQGKLLAAKEYALKLNGTKVSGGKLGNYAMRTGGAIVGSTVNSVPVIGPVLGMLGGEYIARAMQQTQFTSIPAEVKALLQRGRSNIAQPSQSAKTIPTKAIMPKTVTPKGGGVKGAVDKVRSIPNKQGGFISIGGKAKDFSQLPTNTQSYLNKFVENVKSGKPISEEYLNTVKGTLKESGFNAPVSKTKLADFIRTSSDSSAQKVMNTQLDSSLTKRLRPDQSIDMSKVSTDPKGNALLEAQLKNSAILDKGRSYQGSIEQTIEQGAGWTPGLRTLFDRALSTRDAVAVKAMLPSVPESYKITFAKKIAEILNQK